MNLVFLAFVLFQVASASPSQASPLSQLKSNMAGKSGFEVSFTQEVKEELFPDETELASGMIRLKKPDQLEWSYLKPRKRIIRYVDKKLTIEQGGEVTDVPRSDQVSLHESFSFLWGETDPKTFSIKIIDAKRFRISPVKKENVGFETIDVTLGERWVREVRIKNKLEGESVISFSNWKVLN